MKARYRLIRRNIRGSIFYCVDTLSGKRTSLGTTDEDAAQQVVQAKNEALRQPAINLQIAKAYLAGTDSGITTRKWSHAMAVLIESKEDANAARWQRAVKDSAFDLIRDRVIIETQAEQLLQVLQTGTVSTNVYLRRLHNFCVDMNWLPWPILPKSQWPPVRFGEKRAITAAEHAAIVERERNPERRAFYQLAWHLGASQTDLASLRAEDIDWQNRVISYFRRKTRRAARIQFGDEVAAILRSRPASGPLFPYLVNVREADRATEFRQRCQGLGIAGVTLHSYRYAWAERAKTCGYPERYAQEALGHNSQAVHRAYARKAQVTLPSLESFEKDAQAGRIIPFPAPNGAMPPAGKAVQP
jgi:integrase